jgi:hypothetical protein
MHPVETVSGNILNSFHMDLAEKLGATWNQLQCKSGYLWYFRQQLALALHPNPVSNLQCKVERLTVSFQAEWCFLVQLITLSLWVILFVRIGFGEGEGRGEGEVLQFASVPMFYTYLTLEVHSLQLVQLLIQRCSQVWSFHSVRIVLWCILELMCIVYPSANQHNLPFFGWIFSTWWHPKIQCQSDIGFLWKKMHQSR